MAVVDGSAPAESLEVEAELARLARLLGVGVDELAYLRDLPSAELRQLREQVTSALFEGGGVLVRMAAATKLLPVGLIATLSEKVFGPMLSARIAGLVDDDRAVDIADRLSVPFLADVAVELDPRRVAPVLARVPPATIAAVTRQLVAREEWIAMGTFYTYLPDASIAAAIRETHPRALLHITLVLDDKSRLPAVIDLAGIDVLASIAAAAEAEGLTAQLRALEIYLREDQRAAIDTLPR